MFSDSQFPYHVSKLQRYLDGPKQARALGFNVFLRIWKIWASSPLLANQIYLLIYVDDIQITLMIPSILLLLFLTYNASSP